MDMKKGWGLVALLGSLTLSFGCAAQQPAAPPDTRAADEAAIRKADADWSKTGEAKQLDQWMTFYTDDATLLPPNEPMATNKDAIRKSIGDLLALPGLDLKWQPTKVEVSRSGDLGYSLGTYEMTANDPAGKPFSERGKYAEVWKKQADGSWKCAVDMFSSDLPAAPTPAPAAGKK
jgi:ketosteroid isomerase-like protein